MGTLEEENRISSVVVDAALRVHRALGAGLLESAYQEAMAAVLTKENIPFLEQAPVPIYFEGEKLRSEYRLDFLVANKVIIELKAVEKILPVHEAQIITYLKLSPYKLGLLINFNVPLVKDGIRRFVDEYGKRLSA